MPKIIPLLKFPHFIRRISARIPFRPIKYFLWILIACALVINLLPDQLLGWEEEKQLRLAIMANPESSILHEKLGQHYLNINRERAEKEYYLAEIYYEAPNQPERQILGERSSPWQTWTNLVSYEQKITEAKEIFWWVFVGFIIALAAWLIVDTITSALFKPGYSLL